MNDSLIKYDSIILYSTHCPRCNVIKAKLEQKHIPYTEINDVDVMKANNIMQVPMLQVGQDALLDFVQAVKYINDLEDNTFKYGY